MKRQPSRPAPRVGTARMLRYSSIGGLGAAAGLSSSAGTVGLANRGTHRTKLDSTPGMHALRTSRWLAAIFIGLLLPGMVLADGQGSIAGVVQNATRHDAPAPEAEVVLRVQMDGPFVPVATTFADAEGRFRFADLPLEEDWVYLPGANWAGVHYPGPRLRLSSVQPDARIALHVFEAASDPNPLVIRLYEITLDPQPAYVQVTECMLLENPAAVTYVGQLPHPNAKPVTLRLNVPTDFERVTFHKAFFGKRFYLIKEQLVTDLPWPPGKKELKFQYSLPRMGNELSWKRTIDLPCDELRLRVRVAHGIDVACNLPKVAAEGALPSRSEGDSFFQYAGSDLSKGHLLQITLSRLPWSWMVYARWSAVLLLATLGVVVARISLGRQALSRGRRAPAT